MQFRTMARTSCDDQKAVIVTGGAYARLCSRRIAPPVHRALVDRSEHAEPEVFRREQLARERGHLFLADGVDLRLDLLRRQVIAVRELAAAEPDHATGGALERQRQAALDVLACE